MSEPNVISFAALLGHEATVTHLLRATRAGRLGHSLLFSGPDGIGKRSLALAFAAWKLCTEPREDACGTCSSCRQIAAGSSPHVRLVTIPEGKKEIGVEQARDLKRWISLRSAGAASKIAILLNSEMLTVAAQNALLKTLEEPPPGTMILVVSNNADAMLPTVRSRCQRVPLRPLSRDLVVQILRERAGIEETLARDLAALSEGSPGRALALRDTLDEPSLVALLRELATEPGGRYVRQARRTTALMNPESALAVKLELLLHHLRDAALASQSSVLVDRALRRAGLVSSALSSLRRTNPNRQLLLEALLLRLGA